MNLVLRYVAVGFGSVVWAGLVFLAGLHLAFPSEAAKAWLRYQVESQSKEQWTFEATDLDPWRVSGVTATDLTVYKVVRRVRGEGETTPVAPYAHADRFSARFEILPLLASFGKARRIDYKTTLFGSDITGVVGRTGSVTQVLARTSGLDLAKVPIAGDTWTVELTGKANLDVDLEVDAEEMDQSEGHIRLDIEDLALAGGEAMGSKFSDIAGDVIPATFSEAVLEFEVKDGKAEVTNGRFISEPVEIEVSGDIQLRKDLPKSRLDLQITLKFNESLDRLARMIPTLSGGRDPDGTYHLGATGTVLSPRFREDRGASSRSTGSSKRRTPTVPGGEPGELENGVSGQSAEEREKAREERLERLKERRERMRQQREGQGGTTPQPGGDEPPPFENDPMFTEEEGPPPHEPGYEDDMQPSPEIDEPMEQPYTEQ